MGYLLISDLKKTISLLLKNHDLYFGISNISNRLNVLISRPVHLVVASSVATRKGWMPLGRFGRKGSRKEGRREGRKKEKKKKEMAKGKKEKGKKKKKKSLRKEHERER